jgi:hypothetical protein
MVGKNIKKDQENALSVNQAIYTQTAIYGSVIFVENYGGNKYARRQM